MLYRVKLLCGKHYRQAQKCLFFTSVQKTRINKIRLSSHPENNKRVWCRELNDFPSFAKHLTDTSL